MYEDYNKLAVLPLLILNFPTQILKQKICQDSLMGAAEREQNAWGWR